MECRFCLKKYSNRNIFELKLKILHIMKVYLKINKDDDLPKLICNSCVNKLKAIEKFIRQCEESDTYLRNNPTVAIKLEPEVLPSDYDSSIETNEDAKIQLAQMVIQFAACNQQIQNENEIEITGEDLDCSDIFLDDINITYDELHVEDNNVLGKEHDKTMDKKLSASKPKRVRKKPSEVITYICSLCPAKYKNKRHYDCHAKAHENNSKYVCQFCPILFNSRSTRNRHIQSCHNYEVWNLKQKEGENSGKSDSVRKPIKEEKLSDKEDDIVENEEDVVMEDNQDDILEDNEDSVLLVDEDNILDEREDNILEVNEDNIPEDEVNEYTILEVSEDDILDDLEIREENIPEVKEDSILEVKEDNILKVTTGELYIETPACPPDCSDNLLDPNITNDGFHPEEAVENVTTSIQTLGDCFACSLCPAKYRNKDQFNWHVKIHDRSTMFTCQFCQIVFRAKSGLREHITRHHRNDVMRMKLKKRKVSDKGTPNDGEENTTDDVIEDEQRYENCKSYECEICFKVWNTKSDYQRHLNVHVKMQARSCPHCPAVFRSKEFLGPHLKLHDRRITFTCQFCQIVFKGRPHLYNHLVRRHKDEVSKSRHDKTKCLEELKLIAKQALRCSRCPAIYRSIADFDRHVKIHEKDTIFTCQYCRIVFGSKAYLYYHIARSHPNSEIMKNKKEKYSGPQLCQICGKFFQKTRQYYDHMKRHSGEIMYQCDMCSKNFRTKSGITAHVQTHSDVRLYSCNQCSKVYKGSQKLKEHIKRIHLRVSPTIPCNVCGKMFYRNGPLREHMVSHTGEKQVQCDICQKKYRNRATLEKHIILHSDERPYTCSYCPKKFKTPDYVKEHERLHTGETPFKCPVCLRGYAQRCNMKSHFVHNHKELNYKQEVERYKMELKQLSK